MTTETKKTGWTMLDVETPYRTLSVSANTEEARELDSWARGSNPQPPTAGELIAKVRHEMWRQAEDMVSDVVSRFRDELEDAIDSAINSEDLDCPEEDWQKVLNQEGMTETVRQLATAMEDNIDQVIPDLDVPCLGMPSDLERRVVDSVKLPGEIYAVQLARRVHDQTGVPRPIVAMMMRVFTYTGPAREELLKYACEDVQTAAHLDFDVYR